MKIHNSAIISKNAKIANNVEIGPFSIIGDNVEIGEGSVVKSHAVIEKNTKIGKNNIIFPFAVIGVDPQDLKFKNEETFIEIGDNNKIREHCTIHLGTKDGGGLTKIGSNCLLMVGVHIAHDCVVKDNVILANNATLAGHVQVGNNVVIGGLSAVHQFVRIGDGAMIGGMSGVEGDVIPYSTIMGERAFLAGLNLVGMKRKNIDRAEIHNLRNFFKIAFEDENDKSFLARIDEASKQFNSSKIVKEVVDFVQSETSRQFCQMKK
jgi:UDP-N-acetylglucosamine acyltransferase